MPPKRKAASEPEPELPLDEASHTFHVFRSKTSANPPKWFEVEHDIPCGVYSTVAEANMEAKEVLKEAQYDDEGAGGSSKVDKHGLMKLEWDSGEYTVLVEVKAREFDESQEGVLWALWVDGEMKGLQGNVVAAKKAVERERLRMKEEGELKKHSIVKDGLEVKVGKEAVIKAVKWNIMT